MTRPPLAAVLAVAIPFLGALAAAIAGWDSIAIVAALLALLALLISWLPDHREPARDDLMAVADAVRECRACDGAPAHCTCTRDCGSPRCAGAWVQAWEAALDAPHPRHPSGRAR
jgi:hypothetical protein